MTPWPHQARAFERLYAQWPPKLLIADEVGLGKTIQAGMLLRQAWLAGRARRILILAPKAVLRQWQIELREKFNLNWPIYDGRKLSWYRSPALREAYEREVDPREWHREPVVIASSHLLRRRDRGGRTPAGRSAVGSGRARRGSSCPSARGRFSPRGRRERLVAPDAGTHGAYRGARIADRHPRCRCIPSKCGIF